MLDPSGMYPDGFHPVQIDRKKNFKGKATAYTRTQRRPRYILIDFGLSRQYSNRDVVDDPLRGGENFNGRAIPYTMTLRPPRYVLIDFRLSRQYSSGYVADDPLHGGDKSAPEHQLQRPSNPFYTDIYYIGNLVREKFIAV